MEMKHLKTIIYLGAAAALSFSCTREEPCPDGKESYTVEVGASEDPEESKLFLNAHFETRWGTATVEKTITVIDSEGVLNTLDATEVVSGQTSREFKGYITKGSTMKYVLWPVPKTNSGLTSDGRMKHTLTNSQVPSTGYSFAHAANMCVMKPGDTGLRNIMGYIKFKVEEANTIKTIAFSTLKAGEYFAGDVLIDYSGDEPTVSLDPDGKYFYDTINTGAVKKSDGTYNASTYFAVVLPGTYHGIKMTVTPVNGAAYEVKDTREFTVQRGKWIDAGTIPVTKPEEDPEIDDDKVLGEEKRFSSSTTANALCIDGDILYMGDDGNVYSYDVTSPMNPRQIGIASFCGQARQMVVKDKRLFVSARDSGVWIFDISDPKHITLITRFDSVELATGIDAAGTGMFVGQRQNGVEFVDITNIKKPEHVKLIQTGESQSVFYKDGYLYSGEWGNGQITIFDCSDFSNIRKLKTVNLSGYGDGLWAVGNRLYASTGHHHKNAIKKTQDGDGHGMEIWDISDRANPVFISRVEFDIFYKSGTDFWTPRPSGDGKTIFCSDVFNGAYVVDAEDEKNPKVIARWQCHTAGEALRAVAVGNGVLYLAAAKDGAIAIKCPRAVPGARETGITPSNTSYRETYSTPSSSAFTAWKPDNTAMVRGVAAYGDALFAACSDGGLYIVKKDASGKLYKYAKCFDSFAGDVKVRGDKLYVAEGQNGFGVYKIGSGPSISLIKKVKEAIFSRETGRFCVWIAVPNDKYVVAGTRLKGYSFLSITGTDADPVYTYKTYKGNNVMYNKYIPNNVLSGDKFPIISRSTLYWVDLSNTSTASISTNYDELKSPWTGGLTEYKDGKALFLNDNKQLCVMPSGATRATDIEEKTPVDNRMDGCPRWNGADRILLTGTYRQTIRIVNLSNFNSPVFEVDESTAGRPEDGIFWNGKAVVPCGYQGLLIEK